MSNQTPAIGIDQPLTMTTLRALVLHQRSLDTSLDARNAANADEDIPDADEDAVSDHPAEDLLDFIQTRTGIHREVLREAAKRYGTSLGLAGRKAHTPRGRDREDLLWVLPKLHELDVRGETLQWLRDFWAKNPDLAAAMALPKVAGPMQARGRGTVRRWKNANEAVRERLACDQDATAAAIARWSGYSKGAICGTVVWKARMKATRKAPLPKRPRMRRLTKAHDGIAAADQTFEELVNDHLADFEPSPLDDSRRAMRHKTVVRPDR